MLSIEGIKFKNNLLIVAVVATIFSSLTIWLIESPIKYALFAFETALIIIIYIILQNFDLKFKSNHFLNTKISLKFFLDFSLIILSAVLIFFNVFQIGTFLQLPIAFACTTFLAGYALLNISNLKKYFTRLETFVLSFFIGFIFVSFVTLVLLSLDESLRITLIPSFLIILGIGSFFIHLRRKKEEYVRLNSFSKKIDILAIGAAITFYVLFFSFIYPEFSIVPGTDISRHISHSIILSRTPEFYTGFQYIQFHSFESTLNILSGDVSMKYFQTFFMGLNLLLPLTVYALSKRFLETVDKRIPAISTLFYAAFSNFSFLYYLQLKLQETDYTVLEMLGRHVAQQSYFGSIYFAQPFSWFVPQSLGLMIFIFLILLLSVQNIPRSRLIPLMSILIFSICLIHIPEAIILSIFLAFFSIISKSKSLRLDESLISIMIAFTGMIMVIMYTNYFWDPALRIATFPSMIIIYLGVLIPLAGLSLFLRKKILNKLHFFKNIKLPRKLFRLSSILIVSIYLIGLISWFFSDFQTSIFKTVGVVPWYIYPLLLGIPGLLSLISIKYLDQIKPNSFVFFLLIMIPFFFILGHILSYINVNIMTTSFWEKRFIIYIFLASCLLAPIPLVKFMKGIEFKRKFLSNISLAVIISVIVIAGFSTTALQSEFWFLATNQNAIKENELEAINYLKEVFKNEKEVYTISPSKTSTAVVTFSAPIYQVRQPDALIYSKSPEMPFLALSAHGLDHSYLYMHDRDLSLLSGKASWFVDHFIKLQDDIFSNKPVTIYNVSKISPPLSKSDTTLVIPMDHRISYQNSWLFAYDMISQNNHNYTVMYDFDHNTLDSKTILLSYDPPQEDYPTDFIDDFKSEKNWKILSGNWNYTKEGLHGIFESGSLENNILSPITTRDATISTSFKIIPADSKIAEYVKIIYNWEDPDNFSIAQAAFYRDKVYLAFQTMNDGETTIFPKWPGMEIPISLYGWKPGSLFNMTFSKQGEREDLFLNGTRFLTQQEDIVKSGYVGISVDRSEEVIFDHFNIQKMNKLNLRNFSDYLSYVKSGGHLIVLNTNGYGSISNLFLNSDDLSPILSKNLTYVESNNAKNQINLQKEAMNALELAKAAMAEDPGTETTEDTTDTGDTVTIVDTFSTFVHVLDTNSFKKTLPKNLHNVLEGKQFILVAEKSIDNGKITFVNVYPFISDYDKGKIQGNELYKILGELLDSLDLKKIDPLLLRPPPLSVGFKNMEGDGTVKIRTESMLFPNDVKIKKLVINNLKGKVEIENIHGLAIEDYNNVLIESNHISIGSGRGFYSNVILENSIDLKFSKNAIITAMLNDNQSIQYENVSSARIIQEQPLEVIVRQPSIRINGDTTIYKPSGTILYSVIGDKPTSLKVSGNVSLNMFMSDTSSFASFFKMEGKTKTEPTLLDRDKITFMPNFSEPNDIPLTLIPFLLIPFAIAAIFLAYNPNQKG